MVVRVRSFLRHFAPGDNLNREVESAKDSQSGLYFFDDLILTISVRSVTAR